MRAPSVLSFCLALTSLIGSGASAQNPSLSQIVEKLDENQLITLRGNTLPVVNPQTDLGVVRPDLAMTDGVLVLTRSPEQQAVFDAFVASQYDSTSPQFHHWLEPSMVGENFGPSM